MSLVSYPYKKLREGIPRTITPLYWAKRLNWTSAPAQCPRSVFYLFIWGEGGGGGGGWFFKICPFLKFILQLWEGSERGEGRRKERKKKKITQTRIKHPPAGRLAFVWNTSQLSLLVVVVPPSITSTTRMSLGSVLSTQKVSYRQGQWGIPCLLSPNSLLCTYSLEAREVRGGCFHFFVCVCWNEVIYL